VKSSKFPAGSRHPHASPYYQPMTGGVLVP